MENIIDEVRDYVNFNDDDMKWKVLASENLIHCPHLDAYKEKVNC